MKTLQADVVTLALEGDVDAVKDAGLIDEGFGNYKASDDVSFTVEKGKLIGLLGPSGSGKTTILRILAGLENADSGEIYIDGKQVNQIPASKRGIGFVFQNYALFRYKTVFDNIAFGLKIQKWKKADIKNRVDELIELVGLNGLEKRYPKQLSGGQRQRVAFRGNVLELTVRIRDEILIANRQIGQEMIQEGEHVNVFLQRLYLVDENGQEVAIAVNEALRQEESVII